MSGSNPVLPVKKKTPQPNYNENQEVNLYTQFKFLIIVKALFGINRIYLLQCRKVTMILCNIYNIICVCLAIYQIFTSNKSANSLGVKIISFIEYAILAILTMTFYKKTLKKFHVLLYTFDEMLNIQNDLDVTCSSKRVLYWTLFTIFCNIVEFVLYNLIFKIDQFLILIALCTVSHDLEQVFFVTLLRCIYVRVLIIKAHVEKNIQNFSKIASSAESTKIGKLSERTLLDTSKLHEAYELLLKCAGKLNIAINFPVRQNNVFYGAQFRFL